MSSHINYVMQWFWKHNNIMLICDCQLILIDISSYLTTGFNSGSNAALIETIYHKKQYDYV